MRNSSGGCLVAMGAGPPEGPRLTLIQCRGCHGLVWGEVRKLIGIEAQSKTISRGRCGMSRRKEFGPKAHLNLAKLGRRG